VAEEVCVCVCVCVCLGFMIYCRRFWERGEINEKARDDAKASAATTSSPAFVSCLQGTANYKLSSCGVEQ